MFSSSTIESSTSRPTPSARPPEREHVERLPGEVEQDERRDDRERDGDRDDAGGAEAHQEEQDDGDGEEAALHRLVLQRGHRRADVRRLIERDGELHVGRDAAQVRQRGAHRVDHARWCWRPAA